MTDAILRERLSALPACLREVARVDARLEGGSFVVTGIGASEGPARYLAALVPGARFVPLSAFAAGSPRPAGETLIVFSQGLSPNARLALDRAHEYERAILFTSVRSGEVRDRFGGHVIVLPPEREEGALVRIIGPSVAMLTSALVAKAATASDLDRVLGALESAGTRAIEAAKHVPDPALGRRVAFVSAGGHGELCHAARNAWLETLFVAEPPSWDVLQIAHGPFQALCESEIVLIALERDGTERDLFDRLERILSPERHALIRLRSSLPPALAAIDHVAQTHELLCRALRAHPRDLSSWPGRGRDGALYDVGS